MKYCKSNETKKHKLKSEFCCLESFLNEDKKSQFSKNKQDWIEELKNPEIKDFSSATSNIFSQVVNTFIRSRFLFQLVFEGLKMN